MKKILVINAGSATLKFKVFRQPRLVEEVSGIIERIGLPGAFLAWRSDGRKTVKKFPRGIKNQPEAFAVLAAALKDIWPEISLVGHRIVHGGGVYNRPIKLDRQLIKRLEKYNKLAPLHNPANLAGATEALRRLPRARQVAVFDTAYYATMPEFARRYALPEKFYRQGIRRYGFHGISHQFAAAAGAAKAGLKLNQTKIITCHLGGGSSITATSNGRAVDTSMGFTPLSGVLMATRAGDLDAAVPLYLEQELKMSAAEITDLLNRKSGLLGVAGFADMREVLAAAGERVSGWRTEQKFSAAQRARARLALEMFIYQIVGYVGRFSAIMGGLDLLVFTGGVGERSPVIRRLVTSRLKHWRKFKTITVAADEELMIARLAADFKP